jgi:outer membrane lipoprotein-sorting protein
MQVSVITDDNPELGEMTLTFTDKPLELRKWSIRDVQDNTTQVTLQNMRFGMKLDPKLFKFVEQGDSIKAE